MATTKTKKTAAKSLALGFIGVGWIGRNRMEVLLRDTSSKAVAIAEPSEENAVEARKLAKDADFTTLPADIFRIKKLDGVVIATPSAMHAQQSIEALKSGKAVFCQKPLGRTAKEVKQVVEASKEADKLLMVDLSYRYTKAFKALHKIITKGEIGDIYAVDLVFHNAYGPDKEWFYDLEKSGGGCVMDLGVHLVDLALWTLGFPKIKKVNSSLFHKGKKLKPSENQVEDFAQVNMNTSNGTSINLQCSWHVSAGRDAVIEAKFYGTQGGAAFKNENGSFYDFTAEKYTGTQTEILVSPPDDWGGRAGVVWAEKIAKGEGFDAKAAEELIQTAEVIDKIYGRQEA